MSLRATAYLALHSGASFSHAAPAGPKGSSSSSSSVSALDSAGVVSFLSARPDLAARVGPPSSESSWTVKEVGDGNINFVYIIEVSCTMGICHVPTCNNLQTTCAASTYMGHTTKCSHCRLLQAPDPHMQTLLYTSGRQLRAYDHHACMVHLQGPSGGVCLKQSLPFVRCVGEGWPLSQDRCRIEAQALQLEHKLCPQHVPEVKSAC